ncbi:putative gene 9 [Cricetulus griseus]
MGFRRGAFAGFPSHFLQEDWWTLKKLHLESVTMLITEQPCPSPQLLQSTPDRRQEDSGIDFPKLLVSTVDFESERTRTLGLSFERVSPVNVTLAFEAQRSKAACDQCWGRGDGVIKSGFGFVGVGMGAHDTKNEENKAYGEQNQNQPALKAAAMMPQLQDDADLNMICRAFSGLRLSELDRIFQRTQFPNVFVRKELGVSVNVEAEAEPGEPEDEVSE